MKVSFDFDSTLSMPMIQIYAYELVQTGVEVWINTLRYKNPKEDNVFGCEYTNDDLYRVAKHVGIPTDHIVFMELVNKYEFFREHEDFAWHLDDSFSQIKLINEHCKNVEGIWLFEEPLVNKTWLKKCNVLINRYGTEI